MQQVNRSKEELIQNIEALEKEVFDLKNDTCQVNLYKKIFLTTNDHYSIISPDYKYIDVNNSYLKAHGIRLDDILNHKISDIFGDEVFIQFIKANIDKCLNGEEIYYDKWLEFPIGCKRYMQVSYYPCFEKNEIKAVIINSHDVTKLKENELQLFENQKRLSALIENVQEGIATADENENFIFANKKASEIFGYSNSELIGRNLKEFTSAESFKQIQNETKKRKKGEITKYKININRKDGIERLLEVTSTPEFDTNGQYIGSLGIFHDVTEKVIQEQQIKSQNKNLKKLNSEKDKLFSIIAHDLRSPFSGILGFSELLIRNFQKYDENKKYEMIQHINIITHSTLDLLENLLEWANFQKNKTNFNLTEIELSSLVNNELPAINKTALLKNITLTNLIAEEILFNADKNMLQIIIRNLLNNAVKFTENKGEIIIDSYSTLEAVVISVADNGIGIQQERIPYLFTIEQNSTTLGTNSEKGSGLGLVLCREFVEKHGGRIWVESQIGVGTTFFASFPL